MATMGELNDKLTAYASTEGADPTLKIEIDDINRIIAEANGGTPKGLSALMSRIMVAHDRMLTVLALSDPGSNDTF